MITTSSFKPCPDCGKIECNGECKLENESSNTLDNDTDD